MSSKGRLASSQKNTEKSIELGGRKLTFSCGDIAQQANAAVMVSYGETVVLATAVAAPLKADLGYFPLTVDYQERLYAGGRIKGSRWVKREGRPTDEEVLTGRLIDRSIRPLFPKNYKEEVQVIITLLSVDMENSPEIAAGIAASAALSISDIPWNGPIGIVKVGLIDGNFVTNPKTSEVDKSQMELVVSSTEDAIVMIENGSKEVTEEMIVKAIEHGQKDTKQVIKAINDLTAEVGKKKKVVAKDVVSLDIQKKVKEKVLEQIRSLIKKMATKEAGYTELDEVKNATLADFNDNEKATVAQYFEELFREEVRKLILGGKRPDGRKFDEIRTLSAKVGVLPRTHGSAIFNHCLLPRLGHRLWSKRLNQPREKRLKDICIIIRCLPTQPEKPEE